MMDIKYECNEEKKCFSRGTQTNISCFLKMKPMSTITELSAEDLAQEKRYQRSEKFKHILNSKCEDKISVIIIWYSFAGIILGIIFTSTVTLLPQHNVIENPEYWYESIVAPATGFPAAAAGYISYNYFYCLNMSVEKPWRMVLSIFLVGMLTSVVLSCISYLVWSRYLLYPYPMPFQGYVVANVSWSAMLVTSWFMFPLKWRQNMGTRKRLRYCILLFYVMSFI